MCDTMSASERRRTDSNIDIQSQVGLGVLAGSPDKPEIEAEVLPATRANDKDNGLPKKVKKESFSYKTKAA